jgi:uncharacterized protein
MNLPYHLLSNMAAEQPYPLLFATVSGAHLYGFPSPDSDFDLRGCHVLPVREVVGLIDTPYDTIQAAGMRDGLDMDIVTHDAKKFFELMLKRSGEIMEQIYSPLIVYTTPAHEELKIHAKGCLTRHHSHHYLGMSRSQWKLFTSESPRRVKPLLYVYRGLLTGLHLMQTGEVEANLVTLNTIYKLPYIDELIERKRSGPEKGHLNDSDFAFHEGEYLRLTRRLEEAQTTTHLPENTNSKEILHDFLVRLRMAETV